MSWLAGAAWVAAFFLSSVLFSHTVALRLLLLFSGTALVALAIAKERASIRALPPIWIAFALWAAWAALSLAWSIEPQRSAKEFQNEIVYCALALWVCHAAAQARDAARVILPVFALATAAVCTVALYWFPRGFWLYGLGAHGGPGSLSSALITLLPCAVMAGWYATRSGWPWQRTWPAWTLLAFIVASAYTTLNRTIWIAFAVQLLLVGGLLLLRRRASAARPFSAREKVIAVGLALAVAAGGAAVALRIQSQRAAMGVNETLERDPRLALWSEVRQYIAERPLTGYGFGRGILRRELRDETGERELWHSHNLILDILVQTGAPGLLLFLGLLGATLRQGWLAARGSSDLSAACGIALIGVVAGMLLRNMTDMLWVRQNALLYWGIVGILLAWGAAGRTRAA